MAISKRLRFEILRRDNHTCRYCGATAPDVKLTVDHVLPQALGGTDEPTNLVTACAGCNSGKNSIPPDAPIVDDVHQDAMRWAKAMQVALINAAIDIENREAYRDWFLEVWLKYDANDWHFPLPPDWQSSIDRWVDLGVPIAVLEDAVRRSLHNRTVPDRNKFRYMAGIVWRTIENAQQEARQQLAADEADGVVR